MGKLSVLGLAVYLIVGVYFINESLNIVPGITASLSGLNQWINLAAGIMLILGGVYFMRANKYSSLW